MLTILVSNSAAAASDIPDVFALDIEPDMKMRLRRRSRNEDMVMDNGSGLFREKTWPLKENGKLALRKMGYDFKTPCRVSFA